MNKNTLNPSNIVGRTTITEGNYDFYETPSWATKKYLMLCLKII